MRVEREGVNDEIYIVVLSRPTVRNGVDRVTAELLAAAFTGFNEDTTAKVAVLFGEGGVFCAGADLGAISAGRGNSVVPVHPTWHPGSEEGPMGPTRMVLSKPVIAAVSGAAVAGGLELACWCDMRVVERTAYFGVYCRRWGVPLVDGGTIRLLPQLCAHMAHSWSFIGCHA